MASIQPPPAARQAANEDIELPTYAQDQALYPNRPANNEAKQPPAGPAPPPASDPDRPGPSQQPRQASEQPRQAQEARRLERRRRRGHRIDSCLYYTFYIAARLLWIAAACGVIFALYYLVATLVGEKSSPHKKAEDVQKRAELAMGIGEGVMGRWYAFVA